VGIGADLVLLPLKIWDHGTKGGGPGWRCDSVDLVVDRGRQVSLTVAPRWWSSLSPEEIG
jgi:hypothetical protein